MMAWLEQGDSSMEDAFWRGWENLVGRLGRPMSFRFIIQRAVVLFLAIPDGLKDARSGQAPFLWAIFSNRAHRRELLRQAARMYAPFSSSPWFWTQVTRSSSILAFTRLNYCWRQQFWLSSRMCCLAALSRASHGGSSP